MLRKLTKVFSLLMVMVLCVSMLAGCGKVTEKIPEPEELITGAFGVEEVQSIRTIIESDIGANIDMSSIGMSGNMTMSCKMNVEMAGDKNGNTFTNGYIEYDMLGMNGTEKIEAYEISDENSTRVYTFDEDSNSWFMEYSVAKNGEHFVKSIVDIVNVENFADDSLVVEVGENIYAVKGVINSADLKNSLETLNRLIGSENLISNDISFDVVMEFNKITKQIQKLILTLNTETTSEIIKAAYNNLTVTIEICEINNVNIEVPQEILNNMDSHVPNLEETENQKVENTENSN